jgi:hypothetical protein
LSALQHDQTLLAELQRALGGDKSAANAKGGSAPAPSVPRQATATAGGRKRATTAKSAAKPATTKATAKSASKSAVSKPTATTAKPAAAKSTAAQPATAKSTASKSTAAKSTVSKTAAKSAESGPAKPTLVELIREHLGRQSEPRSSAEVATALAEAHPDREIKPKVVRTTVEGLVAKGQVQRSKQGSSVFYTTSKAAPAGATAEQAAVPAATA